MSKQKYDIRWHKDDQVIWQGNGVYHLTPFGNINAHATMAWAKQDNFLPGSKRVIRRTATLKEISIPTPKVGDVLDGFTVTEIEGNQVRGCEWEFSAKELTLFYRLFRS